MGAETAITAEETMKDGLLIAMVLKSFHITQGGDKITFSEFKTKLRSYKSTERVKNRCTTNTVISHL